MCLLIGVLLAMLDGENNAATKIVLLAGGFLASVSTVALAEDGGSTQPIRHYDATGVGAIANASMTNRLGMPRCPSIASRGITLWPSRLIPTAPTSFLM